MYMIAGHIIYHVPYRFDTMKHFNLMYMHAYITAQGIIHFDFRSEKYLGMWKNDRYHGAGILVAMNNFYYAGPFTFGETLKRV